ncbi:ankyrin repeat-containing domain protein [Rhizopus microsporus]
MAFPFTDHNNMANSIGTKRLASEASTISNTRPRITNIWDAITLDTLDIKALYQYIKSNGDANAANPDGYTLLYLAAHNKSTEALCMLLLQQVDVNKVNGPHNELALHAACAKGHLDSAELLIENGSLVNAKDSLGHTPLTNAVFSGSEECIQLLLEHDADVSVVDEQGNSLLHHAASNNVTKAVPLFISKHVPIDAHNQRGLSPLALAISFGHSDVAIALIDGGANVNGRTRFATVLHYAITWNRLDVVKKLVEHGCQVNVVNDIEETPLYLAVQQRKIDLVQYLVDQAKADPCYPNNANLSLLYAASHGYTEICKLVLSKNTSNYFIQVAADKAARVGHQLTAKFLKEKLVEAKEPTKESEDITFESLVNTFSDDDES